MRRWAAAAVVAGAGWAGLRRYLAYRREIDFEGRLAAALAPNATAEAMALAARVLPPPDGDRGDESRRGRDSTTALAPSILTWMADRAAVRNNEIPPPHGNSR